MTLAGHRTVWQSGGMWIRCLPVLLLLCAPPATAAEFNGPARVVDPGTIEIGGTAIRLFGLTAPSADQICVRGGTPWRCGQEAGWALAERLERHWALCDVRTTDPSGRSAAVCYLGGRNGIDVNAWMIEHGWALAHAEAPDYAALERTARQAGIGLWSGKLGAPPDLIPSRK